MARAVFCKAKLKAAFPGVRDEVLHSIAEQMEYFRKQAGSTAEMNKMAKEFYREYLKRAAKIVENSRQNALRINQEVNFIIENFKDNPFEGLSSLIHYVASDKAGTSIETYAHTIQQEAFSILNVGLNRSKLLAVAKSGELDKDVFKIAHARRNKQPLPKDVDPRAIELADIYAKLTNYLQDTVEAAGSQRGRVEGYLGRRKYDAAKVKDMGPERFKRYMTKRLNLEATYGFQKDDPPYISKHLSKMYKTLITEQLEPTNVRAEGPDHLAVFQGVSKDQRLSASRSLVFKDADAEFDVHTTLGSGLVMQDMITMIGRDSRHAGAMSRLGPDYTKNWEAIKSLVSQKSSTKQALKLREKQKFLDGVFNVTVNGFNVGESAGAKLAVAAKALNRVSILGGVTPVSFTTDFATHANNIRNIKGKNLFSATFESLNQYIGNLNLSRKSRLETYEILGSYQNNGLGEYHSRFSPDEIVMGRVSKMQDIFFRLTGQTYQSGHWQFANEVHLGDILHSQIKNNFDNPAFKNYMSKYGLTSEEIRLLGKVSEKVNRRDIITTTAIDKLDISAKQKLDLKLKVGSFLKYNSHFISHPAPGVKTRFLLNMGLDQNSPLGIVTNLATDLLSFPVSILNLTSSTVRGGSDGKSFGQALRTPAGAKTIATLVASLTAAGGISLMMREASNNRKPQLDDPEFWIRAMTLGGALGIYGDFLLMDYSQRHISLTSQVAGPVIGGPVTDLFESSGLIARGKWELNPKEVKKMWDRVPGNNIFYLKAILDYYILEEMQEMVEPGYRNKRKRRERRRGQEPLFGR